MEGKVGGVRFCGEGVKELCMVSQDRHGFFDGAIPQQNEFTLTIGCGNRSRAQSVEISLKNVVRRFNKPVWAVFLSRRVTKCLYLQCFQAVNGYRLRKPGKL